MLRPFIRRCLSPLAAALVVLATTSMAQTPAGEGPYRILKTTKVGGEGGSDYINADSQTRQIYIARSGPSARMTVFNLDTLAPLGEIPMISAHGAAIDASTHHGFASSSPIAMWDTKTLTVIKTLPVEGRPDGIMADEFNHRIYVFSHSAPNVTVFEAKDGTKVGTLDLGGAPEQAASDGKGHIYVDLEDKNSVAVVDARAMKVTGTYSLNGKGGGNTGLALDVKNHVLFVGCREPQAMVMLDARDGKYLADFPMGKGCDGVVFNPKTNEAFASQGDGTLAIFKEKSPTEFVAEQTLKTMPGAKTCTLDTKTGNLYLMAAEFQAPDINVPANGNRPRRGAMVPGSFSIITVGK